MGAWGKVMDADVAGLAATLAANGRDLDALVGRIQRLIDQYHDQHAVITGLGVRLDALVGVMGERFDRVDARLDRINGTVRNHSDRIVALETRHETRGGAAPEAAPPVLRDKRTWQGGGVGAALAGLLLFAWEFVSAILKK